LNHILTKGLLWGFFLGSILIVFLRLSVPSLLGSVFAAFTAALVIIVVYIVYNWKIPVEQREPRQIAGDNLYYLGLLFTLVSLIFALLQIFVFSGDSSPGERANELIGNFGVALLSTVGGILARILMHSGIVGDYLSVPEKPDDANADYPISSGYAEIQENLANLRRMLSEAANAFSHFNRVSAEQAENVLAHTTDTMKKFDDKMTNVATQHLQQVTKLLQEAGEALRSQSSALTEHYKTVIADFNSTLSVVTEQRISDASAAWQQAAKKMQLDGERIGQDIGKLASMTENAWNEMAEMTKRIKAAGDGLDSQAEQMRKVAQNAITAGNGMAKLSEYLEQAQQHLQRAADSAATAASNVTKSADEISQVRPKLRENLEEISSITLKKYGEETQKFTSRAQETLDKELAVSEEMLQEARFLNQQLVREASKLQDLAKRTLDSLVGVIDNLVERVKSK